MKLARIVAVVSEATRPPAAGWGCGRTSARSRAIRLAELCGFLVPDTRSVTVWLPGASSGLCQTRASPARLCA